MNKSFIVGKLNEALSLEEAIVESEQALSRRTDVADLATTATTAARDDSTHMVAFRRIIMDLGGKVEPPPMEARAWVEALVRALSVERDELQRIGLYRLLKGRAVSTGEVLDAIRRNLANPPAMEPLVLILRQDREHAARLAEIEARYAANLAVL